MRLLSCSAWLWVGASPGGTMLPAWLGRQLGTPVFFVEFAPCLLPTQRAMIYKAIIRSGMEYASSAWFGATPASLSQLDAVQRRAIRIIDLPEDDLISHQIQPLGTRREVGTLALFRRVCCGEAPGLLCQLLPERLQLDPRLRHSVRSHDLAVQVPRSWSATGDLLFHWWPAFGVLCVNAFHL